MGGRGDVAEKYSDKRMSDLKKVDEENPGGDKNSQADAPGKHGN